MNTDVTTAHWMNHILWPPHLCNNNFVAFCCFSKTFQYKAQHTSCTTAMAKKRPATRTEEANTKEEQETTEALNTTDEAAGNLNTEENTEEATAETEPTEAAPKLKPKQKAKAKAKSQLKSKAQPKAKPKAKALAVKKKAGAKKKPGTKPNEEKEGPLNMVVFCFFVKLLLGLLC